MSNETTKASKLGTRQALYHKYLVGDGVDIGCGDDPLDFMPLFVHTFDKGDGDAQTFGVNAQVCYDFIYSSHCSEHMEDVPQAIKNWASALKVGGTMFLVVPDFLLYERLQWPSIFNEDHRAAFSLFAIDPSRRPEKFYGYAEMVEIGKAAGLELVHAEIEAFGYDFQALPYFDIDQTKHNACANVIWVYRKL